jgi:flagellar motor switch protein FliN/FliY
VTNDDNPLASAEVDSLMSGPISAELALSHRLASARPLALESFEPASKPEAIEQAAIETTIEDEVELSIELGRTLLPTEEASALREGTVVPLDQLAGDPVDIVIGDRLIARGEVLIVDDNLCVRISEVLSGVRNSIGPVSRAVVSG